MAEIFGLDFGTTNTLAAAVVGSGREGRQAAFAFPDEEGRPHPSVVTYHGEDVVVGRAAKRHLDTAATGVLGENTVRSPKARLGSEHSIAVGGVQREPRDVVAAILRHVRGEA